VTTRPTNAPESGGILDGYGPRLARDRATSGRLVVSTKPPDRRKIMASFRSRPARDIATIPSQDSSTFATSSAGLGTQAGA